MEEVEPVVTEKRSMSWTIEMSRVRYSVEQPSNI